MQLQIDEAKLDAFKAKLLPELGGAASMVVAMLGDKTGLFKAMADAGPLTVTRAGDADRLCRTLGPGMAQRYGCRGLDRLQPVGSDLHLVAGTGAGVR